MIDLHTHSTVSDGSEPPQQVVALASAAGCSALALTDHDSLAGLPAARAEADRLGITLVPGCEVSCRALAPGPDGHPGSMHVLVYFVSGEEGPLPEELARLRGDRRARNRALVDRLAELGIPVNWDDLVADAGGEEGIGRPHFARALVAAGAAEDFDDAFDRWLGNGRPAYIPKGRLGPADVAALARASGGVAVLAHPFSLGLAPPDLERTARELAEVGFGGIEAVYGSYPADVRRELVRMAGRVDLVPTGGSDFHGSFKPQLSVGVGLGDLRVPDDTLEHLAARRPG